MAWIEYHEALWDHWKIQRLASRLEIRYAEALGIVSCLWLWATKHAPKGDLSVFTDDEIRHASRCEVACELKKLLRECVLIDDHDRIYRWSRYGLKLLLSNRLRVKKHRKHVTLQKRNANVTVTPTIPNLTIPDLDFKRKIKVDFDSTASKREMAEPVSIAQVIHNPQHSDLLKSPDFKIKINGLTKSELQRLSDRFVAGFGEPRPSEEYLTAEFGHVVANIAKAKGIAKLYPYALAVVESYHQERVSCASP